MNNITEKARMLFANDLYATQQTAIVIDNVHDGEATCSISLSTSHRNAKGAVMGGVLFTLADFAFAIAVHCDDLASDDNVNNIKLHWVSSYSSINFIRSPKGNYLTATARRLHKGAATAVYQTTILDDEARTVAIVTTTGINTLK